MEGSRNGFRNLLVAFLWLSFVALWVRVYEITTFKDFTDSLSYLGRLGVAYCLLVTVWIVHNIRIYRRKGPRLKTRIVPFSGDRDHLNRRIMPAIDMKREQQIVVDVIGDEKVFGSARGQHPVLTGERLKP